MCNAETRASYVLKSGGNLGEGVFWAGTKDKRERGEGDLFVCVVSLLSCFFAVVCNQLTNVGFGPCVHENLGLYRAENY